MREFAYESHFKSIFRAGSFFVTNQFKSVLVCNFCRKIKKGSTNNQNGYTQEKSKMVCHAHALFILFIHHLTIFAWIQEFFRTTKNEIPVKVEGVKTEGKREREGDELDKEREAWRTERAKLQKKMEELERHVREGRKVLESTQNVHTEVMIVKENTIGSLTNEVKQKDSQISRLEEELTKVNNAKHLVEHELHLASEKIGRREDLLSTMEADRKENIKVIKELNEKLEKASTVEGVSVYIVVDSASMYVETCYL